MFALQEFTELHFKADQREIRAKTLSDSDTKCLGWPIKSSSIVIIKSPTWSESANNANKC